MDRIGYRPKIVSAWGLTTAFAKAVGPLAEGIMVAGTFNWNGPLSPKAQAAFDATLKLAELPRNSAPSRIHNRCEVTGRPKAYYRKLRMSRIALRELGSKGLVPGLVKSSW